jgi:hypothetical protein
MKRNLKSILKYLFFILITAFVTIVIFKLTIRINQHENNDTKQLMTAVILNEKLNSNNIPMIDWHDRDLINVEKLRTGNIYYNLFYKIHF